MEFDGQLVLRPDSLSVISEQCQSVWLEDDYNPEDSLDGVISLFEDFNNGLIVNEHCIEPISYKEVNEMSLSVNNASPINIVHLVEIEGHAVNVGGSLVRWADGSAPITSLSETSSDSDDSEIELDDNNEAVGPLEMEKIFITGVLDELKVGFSYSYQHDHNFFKVLLTEEIRLFEFRAIGGQVEVSIRANDMFIGTVLKSLDIEDLVSCSNVSQRCYLARSFIGSADAYLTFDDERNQSVDNSDIETSEGDDKFYEAPENLADSVDYPMKSPRTLSGNLSSQKLLKSDSLSYKLPSFTHIPGLLPQGVLQTTEEVQHSDIMDSFVTAQLVISDQNSRTYNNVDKKVTITLATLSFFCRRPTILAIMEFVNAINIEDGGLESFSDNSSGAVAKHGIPRDDVIDDQLSTTTQEAVVKGLLGKGKSRIVFNITLNMKRAQILLLNEDETKLASLSQDNLLTDIKVFPSSFSIKASLGNLRISDDSLPEDHMYFWACDMRNPGGSSFVELVFTSFSVDDDDYRGFEYSLFGELSEVRIVYLNRFIQEVVSYFMGLVPNDSKGVVKLKDQLTNSEKWFTTSEIEGSPAVKLDVSLRKPIILMPQRTDSLDYLKLDIVHITVQNNFEWCFGSKSEINAVHSEVLTIQVEDIHLNVGTGADLGESIIQDVKGISIVIQRSLRDLLHQIPNTEIKIKIGELKAALSNREYHIITECAVSNISETPRAIPQLNRDYTMTPVDAHKTEPIIPQYKDVLESQNSNRQVWILTKVSVVIGLVELRLYTAMARDAPLATVQVSGAWLLYKSNSVEEGFLSATLKSFTVCDDREGTEQEFRLAVGKPENIGSTPVQSYTGDNELQHKDDQIITRDNDAKLDFAMLILDVKFSQLSTFVSLCIQRPQLLVALDFLLAVVEFFVPTVGNVLSNEEDSKSFQVIDALILSESTYKQPSAQASFSPQRPLIVDDGRYDHFAYDGGGGILFLKDRQGFNLTAPSTEAIIYVGSGKKLQFKNVVIKNGLYLDSCISLGSNSSYSASEDDHVYLEGGNESSIQDSSRGPVTDLPSQSVSAERSTEFIIELQAIGPELTFYNTSKDVGNSPILSNQLLHAQLDAFCRLVLKGDTTEMNAKALGLTMESNGIRILEPFDTSISYSNASGKTNIHVSVSDIFMNFSFSILRLFLAVEEDILAFLRMAGKKMTVVCFQFDKVGRIKDPYSDQIYAFWRPHAPPGFAVLGDYLTPLDKPPTKGVIVVNSNYTRVKRPVSFKLIWPPLDSGNISDKDINNVASLANGAFHDGESCSIWLPEAPKGYVALGCVVSPGRTQPPVSSVFCISASLVCSSSLRDCIAIKTANLRMPSMAFWRVENSVGTFLPADPTTYNLTVRAYDLRHILFGSLEGSSKTSQSLIAQASPSGHSRNLQSEGLVSNSAWRFEAVASFQLIWWNQGSNSRKKLSIWRPVVPQGTVYFGDIAVSGYEPPNSCIVLRDTEDEKLVKAPLGFQIVGQIKKQRGMESISFWLPQAPPGFVSLGCIACKGTPKQNEFSTLRCMRSDMVTGDQFLEESLWESSNSKTTGTFSLWTVGNELGTFIVRSGFKKPPRRFALKLADVPSGSDDTIIDAEIGTFSAALFDDYGGLMVPLFNVSLSGIGFSLHGRRDYLNSTVSFSLAARSYNDKYESWEPLVEPADGFLR
ncbi:Vacuolar protein sorting-associated protein [Trema orientale]|uniref:Vacuolar protein sorting-associated protein n=1 Tax=Trema orientale TaxID=63057 RepID=A0A2P5FZA1_TREOI|nr:Vacuolar protein sorting-associated protein [Trema orientale]